MAVNDYDVIVLDHGLPRVPSDQVCTTLAESGADTGSSCPTAAIAQPVHGHMTHMSFGRQGGSVRHNCRTKAGDGPPAVTSPPTTPSIFRPYSPGRCAEMAAYPDLQAAVTAAHVDPEPLGHPAAVSSASLKAELANLQAQNTRLARHITKLENRLIELEQQLLDLRQQLEERTDDLTAARELMTELNRR